MKFHEMLGHNPRRNRLDFGGNPDLDPDPGIFEGFFPLRYRQQSKNTKAGGPHIEQIRDCLGGGLRRPSASILSFHMRLSITTAIPR